ncbi:MAG: DUF4446 family protein [Butyrivibrio sp.]|nr:DUF4446 family protein [Butyrivibrio sp.]
MTSNILQSIGLGSIDGIIVLISLLVLLITIIVLFIIIFKQSKKIKAVTKRMDRFFEGKEAASLEEEIYSIFQENELIRKTTNKNQKDINDMKIQLSGCFQKVSIVRYDSFKLGGNLSFALALLDDNNNGVILNSVRSAESCYQYSKVIKNGQCDTDLGKEEEQALKNAMNY